MFDLGANQLRRNQLEVAAKLPKIEGKVPGFDVSHFSENLLDPGDVAL
jgi:hypothetical protein